MFPNITSINDPSLSIGFHLNIYHSHQCIYIVHQSSINQLLDINQWHQSNQTKPFTSMTYDPTISQIIKPLASMTTWSNNSCHAVNALSQFMSQPRQTHWIVVKNILRYIWGIVGYGMSYAFSVNLILQDMTIHIR